MFTTLEMTMPADKPTAFKEYYKTTDLGREPTGTDEDAWTESTALHAWDTATAASAAEIERLKALVAELEGQLAAVKATHLRRCEACYCVSQSPDQLIHVRTINGGVTFCRLCLDYINAKSPVLKIALEQRAELVAAFDRCTAVGPHHGDRCDGGRVQSPNAQFTRQCEECHGSGLKMSAKVAAIIAKYQKPEPRRGCGHDETYG